jgi:hypothetical protein
MVDLTAAGLNADDTQKVWYNQSRSAVIDSEIQPGPYREVLPCVDLCWELVRSCPAILAFGCPRQPQLLNKSYGVFDVNNPGACNFVGKDVMLAMSGGPAKLAPIIGVIAMVGALHAALVWL